MDTISPTDLILNPDGSIYHLHLLPGDISDTIILVGDPGRVTQVSSHFDSVEIQKENREFVTHTGTYKGKRISVLSTGIGTDNIDIVLNELDALVNVDLGNRTIRTSHKHLKLIRIGTSGALHSDIPAGSEIVSHVAGGFDGLYYFYQDNKGVSIPELSEAFINYTGWTKNLSDPYFTEGSEQLINLFSRPDQFCGITLSTPGFYAPQVRSLRLSPFDEDLIRKIGSFSFNGMRVNNFEMESSALYALSAMLGHEAITICVAIANRVTKDFLEDYKPPVDNLIKMVLEKLVLNDRS
ncbi:MAG: nucleoside phosphorylase [Bacteroidales bacterium]|nr:nucleoside phosphorylase [Bacteroidales bacterium]